MCLIDTERSACVQPRFRAPRENRGVLISPPAAEAGRLIDEWRSRRDSAGQLVGGKSLSALVAQARGELLAAAGAHTAEYRAAARPGAGPLILTGHQPELFHPGVWMKNHLAVELAAAIEGTAVNLVIDSDLCKAPAVRVPTGTIDSPRVQQVPLDDAGPLVPFEQRAIRDLRVFTDFGEKAEHAISPFVRDPLVAQLWPLACQRARQTGNLGRAIAEARHMLEGAWGWQSLEVPQSRVCSLPSFCWLTAIILDGLPRFATAYNDSIRAYRCVHRIRNRRHPAGDLATDDGWLEAPYWLWTAGKPRRRSAWVRYNGDSIDVSDRQGLQVVLPAMRGADLAPLADALSQLSASGVALRSKALITTLYARLVGGDLFLHGIGGSKYDQVTDSIIENFFGIRPPAYLTATATLHLPIKYPRVSHNDLARLARHARELEFHPEHHLDRSAVDAVDVRETLSEKRRWIETDQTKDNAQERCRAIRAANARLWRWTSPPPDELAEQISKARRQVDAAAVLGSREYAFCLYPRQVLSDFFAGISPL